MTVSQQIITIIIVILGTALTRFLPFLLFPADKPTPKYIQYLGKVLPPAIFGLLVIYCLKNVSLLSGNHGIPGKSFLLRQLSFFIFGRDRCFCPLQAEQSVNMFFVQFIF